MLTAVVPVIGVLVVLGCVTTLVIIAGVAVLDAPGVLVVVDPGCGELVERDAVEVVVAEDTLPPVEDTVLDGIV